MDKQEAVAFIIQEHERNRPRTEIITELSQRLGAPPEMVSKFIDKVAADYKPLSAAPAPPVESFYVDQAAPMPKAQSIGSPAAATAPGPAKAPPPAPTPQTANQPRSSEAEQRAPLQEEIPDLEEMILKALAKNKRQSDVVVMVCEQTNMTWDQAQRTVARVATKNRKTLSVKQNWITYPLIFGALLVGVALIIAAVSEGYTAANQVNEAISGNTGYIPSVGVVREGIWAFLTGIVLVIGGVAGLIMALQKQFE